MRFHPLNTLALVLAPAMLIVAGCGGRVSAVSDSSPQAARLSVSANVNQIDTNGRTQFSATLPSGEPAAASAIEWSVKGGDASAGAGSISPTGLYMPPSYLTEDAVTVSVSALLTAKPSEPDTTAITITPGFLQPLTPENLALGANATVTVSGSLTEVGGNGGIRFSLASDTAGTPIEAGTLSPSQCTRGSVRSNNPAYTVCTTTYTAPALIPASTTVYIVGSVASGTTKSWARVLLNSAGITSNPATHQAHLAVPVQLGSSSGNNTDYDAAQGQLSDCCGGTLGALLQDTSGNQYVLSNNHVLSRSDQSIPGETIIQPGLIDNGCTPYGVGPGTTPVATLTGYPSLRYPITNVDAAIARVTPGAVDSKGSILEFGAKQIDGTLAPAPPGISSTAGKGEEASLGMMVAKSGRTTGLTCAAVSAVSVDVLVDYYTDCAETTHAMTKAFTNQVSIAGTSFSDAGDSGALIVDAATAEPVGLFFAGGTDADGVEHAIANPIGDVLSALSSQVPSGNLPTRYSMVGGQDHPVSCLNYGSPKSAIESSNLSQLSADEQERVERAISLAQVLLNPSTGVVRITAAASQDHPGKGAIGLHFEANPTQANLAAIPSILGGLPTVLIPNKTSPESPAVPMPHLASLTQAVAVKQRNVRSILKSNPAIFGVGVGQSLDSPGEAAVILFVDRKKNAGSLPDFLEGQRVRVIFMDRLHVTRSHGTAAPAATSCQALREHKSQARLF